MARALLGNFLVLRDWVAGVLWAGRSGYCLEAEILKCVIFCRNGGEQRGRARTRAQDTLLFREGRELRAVLHLSRNRLNITLSTMSMPMICVLRSSAQALTRLRRR